MSMNAPWIRQVQVDLGPLDETAKLSDPKTSGIRLFGDGSQDGLRIKFSIVKHLQSTATPTVVSIYNLKPSTRNAIIRGSSISIKVGWQSDELIEVYRGGVLRAVSYREGSDIVTTIHSLSCYAANFEVLMKCSDLWPKGSLLDEIVFYYADKYWKDQNVVVNLNNIDTGITLTNPMQVIISNGLVSTWLQTLGKRFDFSFNTNDGIFRAMSDFPKRLTKTVVNSVGNPFFDRIKKISVNDNYLLRAEPMLVAPWQYDKGVRLQTLLIPRLFPGDTVNVVSQYNTEINGPWLAWSVNHYGDTHSSQWETNIESFKIGTSK